jgi:hypothetical protein
MARFAEKWEEYEPEFVAAGALPYEVKQARELVAKIDAA